MTKTVEVRDECKKTIQTITTRAAIMSLKGMTTEYYIHGISKQMTNSTLLLYECVSSVFLGVVTFT